MPLPEGPKVEERKKILVVDDDKIIVETIVQSLEEDEFGIRNDFRFRRFRGRPSSKPFQTRPPDSGYHDARHQWV